MDGCVCVCGGVTRASDAQHTGASVNRDVSGSSPPAGELLLSRPCGSSHLLRGRACLCASAGAGPPPPPHVSSSVLQLRHKAGSICCCCFPLIIGLNNGMPVCPPSPLKPHTLFILFLPPSLSLSLSLSLSMKLSLRHSLLLLKFLS